MNPTTAIEAPGRVFSVVGDRCYFLVTGEESGGAFAMMDFLVPQMWIFPQTKVWMRKRLGWVIGRYAGEEHPVGERAEQQLVQDRVTAHETAEDGHSDFRRRSGRVVDGWLVRR